eukprot:SAG11_NODE_321_length_10781_cov_6.440835_6_plen_202_part_00
MEMAECGVVFLVPGNASLVMSSPVAKQTTRQRVKTTELTTQNLRGSMMIGGLDDVRSKTPLSTSVLHGHVMALCKQTRQASDVLAPLEAVGAFARQNPKQCYGLEALLLCAEEATLTELYKNGMLAKHHHHQKHSILSVHLPSLPRKVAEMAIDTLSDHKKLAATHVPNCWRVIGRNGAGKNPKAKLVSDDVTLKPYYITG